MIFFLAPIAILGMLSLLISIIADPCEICGMHGHSTISHEADDIRNREDYEDN